ncbi:AAA family ATPase [Desulfonema magnum]|uniref:AAA ATPase domain-containing protein n=1 Tax=Desulfonema magnum TaxID=45655 RepID=A0A975GP27_9BACT|nr:AAA family ATPase [Desulfonema magnum]QTA87478.1 AAA ATPase domain-containing protein [Desulfonema magnum]
MITELKITGFRGFKDFSLNDLGRINLLVGSNNGGKTSVLEALEFLASRGNLRPIFGAMRRRGEHKWPDAQIKSDLEMDICRLFYGYEMQQDSQFSISGKRMTSADTVQAEIQESESESLPDDSYEFLSPYILKLTWNHETEPLNLKLRLSHQGGLSYKILRTYPPRQAGKSLFVSTLSLSADEIVPLFEDIVLTPDEQLVIESIRHIEPTIERIASLGSEKRGGLSYSGTIGGLVVKCKGIDQRIPIGSMGDGIWRMLGITLALIKAKEGILLVDEIDTGLHFTVMEDMWKLIAKTAERLNVQVFATTHNSDCWSSLATILCDKDADNKNVSIQRIEKNKKQAVAFTRDEIIIAAKRGIEVR